VEEYDAQGCVRGVRRVHPVLAEELPGEFRNAVDELPFHREEHVQQ
jgi:hypothetical protein